HQRRGRLRRRRRGGQLLSPGRHRRRHRLHGGAGRRALAAGARRTLSASAAWRWAVWCLLLGLFTYGLLSAKVPHMGDDLIPQEMSFWVSKGTHLFGYALLSALVAWLPAGPRFRVGLWLLLVVHGPLTEYLQTFIDGRTGSPRDVVIDWLGVSLGWC